MCNIKVGIDNSKLLKNKQIADKKCKQTFVKLVGLITEHMQPGQLQASNQFVYLELKLIGPLRAT